MDDTRLAEIKARANAGRGNNLFRSGVIRELLDEIARLKEENQTYRDYLMGLGQIKMWNSDNTAIELPHD